MAMGLTPDQLDCARVIAELTALNGRSPSLREIADELDLAAHSGASRLLAGLLDRGWLKMERVGPGPFGALALTLLHQPPPLDTGYEVALTPAAMDALRATDEGGIA